MRRVTEEEIIQSNVRVYIHIAHALARGYTDLFYVNMDTDEFIEFHTEDERGVLNEARRGLDFFESCEREAKLYVHQDDQATFVKAMNRQFLEEALDGNKVYIQLRVPLTALKEIGTPPRLVKHTVLVFGVEFDKLIGVHIDIVQIRVTPGQSMGDVNINPKVALNDFFLCYPSHY